MVVNALRSLCIALMCAYPVGVHFSAVAGRPEWGLALMLALVGVVLRFFITTWSTWALAFAPVVGALLLVPPQVALYAPPVVLNLALATAFGATLRRGTEPFISRIARLERSEPLDARLAAYTRRVTQIWTGFFVVLAIVSAALAAFAPLRIWSLFTNGLAYLLISALFLGEWLYRRVRLSEYQHAPPWELVRTVARSGLSMRAGDT